MVVHKTGFHVHTERSAYDWGLQTYPQGVWLSKRLPSFTSTGSRLQCKPYSQKHQLQAEHMDCSKQFGGLSHRSRSFMQHIVDSFGDQWVLGVFVATLTLRATYTLSKWAICVDLGLMLDSSKEQPDSPRSTYPTQTPPLADGR